MFGGSARRGCWARVSRIWSHGLGAFQESMRAFAPFGDVEGTTDRRNELVRRPPHPRKTARPLEDCP